MHGPMNRKKFTGSQWESLKDGYRFGDLGLDESIILRNRKCTYKGALWPFRLISYPIGYPNSLIQFHSKIELLCLLSSCKVSDMFT